MLRPYTHQRTLERRAEASGLFPFFEKEIAVRLSLKLPLFAVPRKLRADAAGLSPK
jgi:hypothetical protein